MCVNPIKIQEFADYCCKELDLYDRLVIKGQTDPNESFYKSLPICIIDAVFSIGVKYTGVEKTVKMFIEHFNLQISRQHPIVNEYTISKFLEDMKSFDTYEEAAEIGFDNKQRTSSRNGILKAEACVLVAEVFARHGIDTLADFAKYINKEQLDKDILQVKGQSSGIMLKYLYMLAGKSDEVKPDRHVVSFLKRSFPYLTIELKYHEEIKEIFKNTVAVLKKTYPQMTERFLDSLIWEHMRQ